MYETIGELLHRHRRARGWSQHRLAQLLCAAAGQPTLSRHEISRWERGERLPGQFWLGWLSAVLGVPGEDLSARAAATRRHRATAPLTARQRSVRVRRRRGCCHCRPSRHRTP